MPAGRPWSVATALVSRVQTHTHTYPYSIGTEET